MTNVTHDRFHCRSESLSSNLHAHVSTWGCHDAMILHCANFCNPHQYAVKVTRRTLEPMVMELCPVDMNILTYAYVVHPPRIV